MSINAKGKDPDVSVIIPVYRRFQYLQEAIDSVFDQDWNGELEVIVVADGLDLEPESALSQPNRPGLRILKKDHQGVGAARQFGIEHARGRYLAFNDDDDIWLPGKLSMQFAIMEAYPQYDMLFSDLHEFYGDQVSIESVNSEFPEYVKCGAPQSSLPDLPPVYRHEPNSLLGVLMNGAGFFFQTILARREFVERIGGMDPRTPSCGDCLDFGLRANHFGVLGYLDAPSFKLRRGHMHMTATGNFSEKEISEFFNVYPDYPEALKALLQPWMGYLMLQPAYVFFGHRQFRKAAEAYRKAFEKVRPGLTPRLKYLISLILGSFQKT